MTKKQEVLVQSDLVERAQGLDKEARRLWAEMDGHLTAVEIISIPFGKVCTEMRNLDLHKYVRKGGGRKGYPTFPDWIASVTGNKLSKSSLYMAMGLHKLTEGPNALPPEEVVQMPKDNAYRLSTLEPEQRTPEMVDLAKKSTKEEFPKRFQEKLNEGKPLAEQRVPRVDFFRSWYPDVKQKFEETIERFTRLPIVRDSDGSLTLQEKAVMAICFAAERDCQDLLSALEAKHREEVVLPDTENLSETEHEADPAFAIEEEHQADRTIIRKDPEYVSLEEAEASFEQ